MTAAQVKLFAVSCLVASSCFAQLNVRNLTATTAVESASIPASVPLRWYRGESVNFNHWSTEGGTACAWTNLSNLVAVWSLTANRSDDQDPDNSNTYMWVTGAVTAASGKVTFSAQPSWTAMPASNYWSFVTLYQTDALGLTNEYIGVLHRANANVLYRDTGVNYAGPWEVPSNMVDSYARSLIAAGVPDYTSRSNTAAISTALTTETNRAQVAESGLSASIAGVNVTATNALTNSLLAIVAAASKLGGSAVTNALVDYLGSNTVPRAMEAMYLKGTNANYSWEMNGGVLTIYEVTNTVNVRVTATNNLGLGYNGPPVGMVFTNPVWSAETVTWTWGQNDFDGEGNIVDLSFTGDADIFAAQSVALNISGLVPIRTWSSSSGALVLQPSNAGVGSPTIAFVPATNTYTLGFYDYAPRDAVSFTNGLYGTTNAAVHTANGTNWYITFE